MYALQKQNLHHWHLKPQDFALLIAYVFLAFEIREASYNHKAEHQQVSSPPSKKALAMLQQKQQPDHLQKQNVRHFRCLNILYHILLSNIQLNVASQKHYKKAQLRREFCPWKMVNIGFRDSLTFTQI